MSRIFKIAKKNYDKGLWSRDDLQRLVDEGKLPKEEFDEIVSTGENDTND